MTNIYTLSDPDTGKVRYVGKTCKSLSSRYAQHIYAWKRCSGKKLSHVNNWIKNLAIDNKKPVIELVDVVEDFVWQDAEKGYILLYKSFGCNLTNLTLGGEGTMGYKATDESKKKRLESLAVSKFWKEKIERHSEIMKDLHKNKNIKFGYAHLDEEKRKEIGAKHSLKMKQKHLENPNLAKNISASRRKPVELITIDGKVLFEFESVAAAGRALNIDSTHIVRVCKGKSKHAYGYYFQYKK